MSKATTHRSSEEEYNGSGRYFIFGGLVSANATTRFIRFVAPCDGYIQQFDLGVIVSPTNAAAVIRMGLDTDTDYFFDDKNIQNVTVNTTIPYIQDPLFVNRNVNKGDRIVVEFTNADTTGELEVGIVIVPRQA